MTDEQMIQKSKEEKVFFTPFSIFCIMFGLSAIAFTFFQWDLVDYLTPFLLMPLLFLSWIILAILLIASLIYIPVQIKKQSWRAIMPLIINGIVLLILYFVPFTNIWLEVRFRLNKPGFEQVISMYEKGEFESDERGFIQLPIQYRYLSKGGGEIIVDNNDGVTSMFFYTFRGILDSSSGFIYRANDTPPPRYSLRHECMQFERLEPKWFFCADH